MTHLLNRLSLTTLAFHTALLFSAPIGAEPANLTLVKNEIKKYHDSGLYEQDVTRAVTKAQSYIISQALINQKKQQNKKLALVLDIDETSLSNYNNMVHHDFTGTDEQFHQAIMAADAPAIKPTLALYQDALRHGITVFFVTGRNESERAATQKNLVNAGYTQWSELYLRPIHYAQTSIIPFKTHAREMISKKGYTIVASIGDQYSDLKGGYVQKGFKLPNPFYYLP